MKKLSLVLRCVASVVVCLVALVFAFLEATHIVTLDFTLYENQFIAFVQLVLRFGIALSAGVLGVFSLVKRNKSFLPHSLCLLASSAVLIPFASNNVGLYITAVSAFFALTQLLFAKCCVEITADKT
ncbi:MAG: hypothetical protein J6Q55_03345 [Clostridia bacterium]|nr:hypothetical protein [Clostridia bacterium]